MRFRVQNKQPAAVPQARREIEKRMRCTNSGLGWGAKNERKGGERLKVGT